MINKKSKIYVAGHKGMVGSAIIRKLKKKGYSKIIFVDKNYLRPLDVNTLLGNASKARRELKWKPQINIHTLIDEMITEEMNILNNDQ